MSSENVEGRASAVDRNVVVNDSEAASVEAKENVEDREKNWTRVLEKRTASRVDGRKLGGGEGSMRLNGNKLLCVGEVWEQ